MRRPATTLKVGVVGAGVMGARHARTIAAHPLTALTAVVDHSLSRAEQAASLAPGACAAVESDVLDRCDAVVVATSTTDHRDVTMSLLSRGIPVFVEKPLALTAGDCDAMMTCSVATGVPLMCGFVERFNSGWLAAQRHLDSSPASVDAIRQSPAVARAGSGVITDVMIHDLDLAASVFGSGSAWPPSALRCDPVGADSVRAEIEWDPGRRLRLIASREASEPRRIVRIAWDTGWMEIDLLAAAVSIGRQGSECRRRIDCRSAQTSLRRQLSHFVALVEGDVDAGAERASIIRPHELAFELERALLDRTCSALALER